MKPAFVTPMDGLAPSVVFLISATLSLPTTPQQKNYTAPSLGRLRWLRLR